MKKLHEIAQLSAHLNKNLDAHGRRTIRALYNYLKFQPAQITPRGLLVVRIGANVYEFRRNKAGRIVDAFLFGTVTDAARLLGVRF